MKNGTFISSAHLEQWFTDNPGFHRTDQQGRRMICPKRQSLGYPVVPLQHRPNRTTYCPNCQATLDKAFPLQLVEPLPGDRKPPPRRYIGPVEKGELGWRPIA